LGYQRIHVDINTVNNYWEERLYLDGVAISTNKTFYL